jgi:hypothetical protein
VRGDWEFWKRIDTEFLQISTRMVVLTIPGWRKSTGVQAEIKIGARLGLDISFMHPIPEGGYLYTSSPQDDSYKVSVDLY